VGPGSDDLTLRWDSVLVDFLVEGLAQSDSVFQILGWQGALLLVIVKPEPHGISPDSGVIRTVRRNTRNGSFVSR